MVPFSFERKEPHPKKAYILGLPHAVCNAGLYKGIHCFAAGQQRSGVFGYFSKYFMCIKLFDLSYFFLKKIKKTLNNFRFQVREIYLSTRFKMKDSLSTTQTRSPEQNSRLFSGGQN